MRWLPTILGFILGMLAGGQREHFYLFRAIFVTYLCVYAVRPQSPHRPYSLRNALAHVRVRACACARARVQPLKHTTQRTNAFAQ